jgi:DNA ligase (NAD+)
LGFTVVPIGVDLSVEDLVKAMTPELCPYPVDGLIFEMTSKKHSKSLASTSHHEGCRMALKWADSTYETVLRDVIWDVGRSGVISPVAVFDEVDLDGALTTRATLHNLSIIESLELGLGDIITVYRSNMVIPKIDDNLTRSNNLAIPDTCPCCGEYTEIKYTDSSKFLMCSNQDCSAKLVAKFTHFVSRDCMNIEGLSEATLELLIKGTQWVSEFKDIYHLKEYRCLWAGFEGYGEKSVDKILSAIEKSRNVKLENFICALSIDGVGKSGSKTIADAFNSDFNAFYQAFKNHYNWADLSDIGEKTSTNITKYLTENEAEIVDLASEMRFIIPIKTEVKENPFSGKTLCVTGKLNHFTRDSINEKIAELGAKAASSVSKNTDYLITNEASGSSKYKKAVELNVPIISEAEFIEMIGESV